MPVFLHITNWEPVKNPGGTLPLVGGRGGRDWNRKAAVFSKDFCPWCL